jgi:CoA:oxalate CoA-transferase
MRLTSNRFASSCQASVPESPINTYDRVFTDPHVLEREMVVGVKHPVAGPTRVVGIPVKLSDTPGAIRRPAPVLGEHTAEILTELGYSETDQERLRTSGAI